MWGVAQRPLLGFVLSLVVVSVISHIWAIPPVISMIIGTILCTFFLVDLFTQIDTYQRYVKLPRRKKFRVLEDLQDSFCRRGVGIAIYGSDARLWYHLRGYRWYHLFPDGFHRRALTKRFWQEAFTLPLD